MSRSTGTSALPTRVVVGFAIALALLALSVVLVITQANAVERAQQQVERADAIRVAIEGFDDALGDAVAGQRGWLLSPELGMLVLYERGARASADAVETLRRITAGDAVQRARVDTLSMLRADVITRALATLPPNIGVDAAGVGAAPLSDATSPEAIQGRLDVAGQLTTRMIATEREHASARAAMVDKALGDVRMIEVTITVFAALVVLVALTLLSSDIARRTRVEGSLRATNRQFRAVFDSSFEFILLLDPEGRILDVNLATLEQLGHERSAFVNQLLWEAPWFGNSVVNAERIREAIADVNRGRPVRYETEVFTADSRFTLLVAFTPVEADDGTVAMIVLEGVDISSRRESERLKDQFIALASHEIRAPITALRGSLKLLESRAYGLDSTQRELLAMSGRNADRLLKLVSELLDLERLESGGTAIEWGSVSSRAVMEEARDILLPLASEAGLTIVVTGDDERFDAEGAQMVRVLVNLAGNAIKFSPAGAPITMRATTERDHVRFAVEDQGRGIPHDERARIFDRFAQVEHGDSIEKGGTGLGLAIALAIVRLHGGRLWVDDAPRQGSVFVFTIPKRRPPSAEAPVAKRR